MKNFTAIYMMPAEGLQEWMAKPEEERKEAETAMQEAWNTWMEEHKGSVMNTVGLGKAKRVTQEGIVDAPNGLMMASYVQAESAEEASEIFRNHPHLQIPGASIEVMGANPI